MLGNSLFTILKHRITLLQSGLRTRGSWGRLVGGGCWPDEKGDVEARVDGGLVETLAALRVRSISLLSGPLLLLGCFCGGLDDGCGTTTAGVAVVRECVASGRIDCEGRLGFLET